MSRTPWWSSETIVPLHEVPALLPLRRNGRPVSLSTIYRWSGPQGAGGVRLRRFRPAGVRGFSTTIQELERFAVALTALSGEEL